MLKWALIFAVVALIAWFVFFAGTPNGTPWPDETSGSGP